MNEKDTRIISSIEIEEDKKDFTHRPSRLDAFLGQEDLKEILSIHIHAAKERGESLDHVLLSGPPGLGKTTLSHIIANELGVNIKSIAAPVLEKTGEIAAHLTSLEDGDVFFIDEIHRLKRNLEEVLYGAMEDFKLDIIIGQGAGAKSVKINLPRFTLVGATTRAGKLTAPLRNRFGINFNIDLYDETILSKIALRYAYNLGVQIDEESSLEIAKRSRGTPRVVNMFVRKIRDWAQTKGQGIIDLDITKIAFETLGVDENGLTPEDRKLLKAIIDHYEGGPVGLKTLSITLNESDDTIEDVYEPYLIQKGLLMHTRVGRVVTANTYRYFGLTPKKKDDEPMLF